MNKIDQVAEKMEKPLKSGFRSILCRSDDGWVALSRILMVTQFLRGGEGE
jgi:hypothetical protein